jgi:hypothetical protein
MSDLLALCRHESAHALHAYVAGCAVLGLKVNPDGSQGYTDIVFPLCTESTPKHYQQNPELASICLQKIVSTLLTGAQVNGETLCGKDAADIQLWQAAYAACGADISD